MCANGWVRRNSSVGLRRVRVRGALSDGVGSPAGQTVPELFVRWPRVDPERSALVHRLEIEAGI